MVENAQSLDRVGDITGRRVDFTEGPPLAWGIEIELPFDTLEKTRLDKKCGIKIPRHIDTLKYLDLNPQESMPVRFRNIKNSGDSWYETNLYLLTAPDSISKKAGFVRRKTIEEIFYNIFGRNNDEIEEFNSILLGSNGNTILLVEGHSWDAPWKIGERHNWAPIDSESRKLQKSGNNTPIRDILKRYNDSDKYSAILIYACYNGKRKIKALDIPLAYGLGKVGSSLSQLGLLPTVIVKPRYKSEV